MILRTCIYQQLNSVPLSNGLISGEFTPAEPHQISGDDRRFLPDYGR